MDKETYEGRLCKLKHDNGAGKTIRHVHSRQCVVCAKEKMASWRDRNREHYKAYQAAYHANLRANNIEKIIQYHNTQVERGHTYQRKKK